MSKVLTRAAGMSVPAGSGDVWIDDARPMARLNIAHPGNCHTTSVPKRFLILTQHFPPEVGAAQIRLHAFAKQLQARGHEVRVVTAMPNYPRGEVFPEYRGQKIAREEIDGLPVTRTWIHPATGRNVVKRLLSYWSFAISSLPACMLSQNICRLAGTWSGS